ncbi:MAG: prepilin-type N-terminal cleavage/methylation domain-containing protein [Candidatus Edwardsbacteria bacterium]|nr:prepilin-type N-terminal cleavage/methylation domain-containing protein [Candidatus Edwardsbacteria bacterium]
MSHKNKIRGFTLIETMIALVMFSFIVAAVIQIFISSQKTKRDTELVTEAQQTARILLDMIAEDVRSAGYGANSIAGHTPIGYAGPYDLMINANFAPYPDNPDSHGTPLAINPTALPLPGNGLYAGSVYSDGAETIRYSFDSNNDGLVTVDDRGDDLEERLTPNTNLYCLARQVFGYNPTTTSNGGTVLPVGLVRVSTSSGVVPMFTYYYYDQTVTRDRLWGDANGDSVLTGAELTSVGPITSATILKNITKVGINVQAQTSRPNSKGAYVEVSLNTIITITRNKPIIDGKTIFGRVAVDANHNNQVDLGEAGVDSVKVELSDGQVQYTTGGGNYSFSVAPKIIQIKVTLPEIVCGATAGYKPVGVLDTIVDATSANIEKNFPVETYVPGFLRGHVYEDLNNSGGFDDGEGILGAAVNLVNSAKVVYSDATGLYCAAVEPRTTDVVCSPPDVIYVPVTPSAGDTTITITAGSYTDVDFRYRQAGQAFIGGKVFKDANPLKTFEGEPGIGGVIITAYTMDDMIPVGQDTTDDNGDFLFMVPENDASNMYFVEETDSAGWISTTPNFKYIGLIAEGDTIDTLHFGDIKLQAITINAVNVMCMTVNDFYEYEGGLTTHLYDEDIVLGTMYNATGNILGWFDKCNDGAVTDINNLFSTNADYTRTTNILANISAMASDTMNRRVTTNNSGSSGTITDPNYKNSRTRKDLVIGLDNTGVSTPSYNLVVWPTIDEDSSTGKWGQAQYPSVLDLKYNSTPKYYLMAQDANYVVNSIALGDFGGDGFPDIVAGFSTAQGANSGGFNLWLNKQIATSKNKVGLEIRDFRDTCQWTPALNLGAVKAVASCYRLFGTYTDLVVGTRTSDGAGRIIVYQGNFAFPWFTQYDVYDPEGEVVSLKTIDINNDGLKDIVSAVKTADGKGKLQVWLQGTDQRFGQLVLSTRYPNYWIILSQGEPTSMATDFMKWSSSIYPHIVVGIKSGSYSGMTLLFDCFGGVLVNNGNDISEGMFNGEVAAVTIGDFNQDGVRDVAIAEKKSATEGHLVIFFPDVN